MKQTLLTVFHSRTADGGWCPGFQGRTFIEPERAKAMNQHFETSGVKLVPFERAKKPGPWEIVS